MSKIIQLGEHAWQLPPEPKSASEVLFSKELPRNQYWRRLTDYPKFFTSWDSETRLFAEHTITNDAGELISLNKVDSKRLLFLRDQELRRRRLGVWMMNDGELTYLSGGHYFALQWGQLMGSVNERTGQPYAEYREFQARFFYFLQMCKEDPECLGAYFLKPKKTGITQMLALDILDESTRLRGKWFGMMSKTLVPDCRDVNFGMYKHGFENLPNIMKPSIANENLTMMFFGNPVNNKNNNRKRRAGTNGNLDWLNTRITALPTKSNGFDGGMPFRAWTDEFPKYEDPYPEDLLKPTSAAVKMQSQIIGKWWITSYTPEDDKKNKEQAEKVYYEAKLRTRDDRTKRTKNELYAYFINTLDSAKGSFDIYGKADRKKTQIWISSEVAKLKDDKSALQSFHRVNPTSEDEAWRSGGAGGSTFDNIRLFARKFKIQEDQRVGKLLYKEYNLEWVPGGENLVVPIEVTEDDQEKGKTGRFRFYRQDTWRQESLNEPVKRKLYDAQGLLMPSETCRYVTSLDPTNYSLGRLVAQASKNSMWVFSLPDSEMNARFKSCVTGRHIVEYLYRHNKPSDTLEDIKKIIYLFGSPIAIEGNMSWAITKLIEDGLQNFVLVRDSKTKAIVPYNPHQHQSMITTNKSGDKGVMGQYITATQEYLGEPRNDDEFDNLENVDSEILIQDLMDFDADNTRKYDHAVGFMLGVQTMTNYVAYMTKMIGIRGNYSSEVMTAVVNTLIGEF